MLMTDTMMGSEQPRLQIREGNMNHRQVSFCPFGIAVENQWFVRVPHRRQVIVPAPTIGAQGQRAATKLLRRVEFRYTPKHASWLNMAEIEIGILSRQCLDRRIANLELLESEVAAWQQVRNEEKRTIEWNFTRQDADKRLGRHYVSKLAC